MDSEESVLRPPRGLPAVDTKTTQTYLKFFAFADLRGRFTRSRGAAENRIRWLQVSV